MKQNKPQKTSKGVSRANMLIRRGLGWLRGFPDENGNWVSLPSRSPVTMIQIGGTEVRRATFALNKLRREFPKALPRIVGDVDEWMTLHRSLIETLKPSVHGGATLPSSGMELHPGYRSSTRKVLAETSRDYPLLQPALCAFSWTHWLEPQQLRKSIVWLRENSEQVTGILANVGKVDGCVALAQLWILENTHNKARLRSLLWWLADPGLFGVSLEQGYQFANQAQVALNHKEPKEIPQQPSAKLGNESLRWLSWLAQQDDKTARRALEIFDLLSASVATEAWHSWWGKIARLIKRAQALPTPLRRRHPNAQKLRAVRAKLCAMRDATPPVVSAKRFFALVREEATHQSQPQYRAIRKTLELMPTILDGTPIRIAFLAHWNALRRNTDLSSPKKLTVLIGAFGAFLREQDDVPRALRPWQPIWGDFQQGNSRRFACYGVDRELLEELPRTNQFAIFFDALALLQEPLTEISNGDAETLVEVVLATKSSQAAAAAFAALKRDSLVENYLPASLLQLAGTICGSEIESFAKVTKALLAGNEQIADLENTGTRLIALWKNSLQEHLRRAVLDGQLMGLCATVLKAEVIRQVGGRVPTPALNEASATFPRWARRYPKPLHEALVRLCACDASAEMTAGRILNKDFPDPLRTREQIAALKVRLLDGASNDALTARIGKLESWLIERKIPGVGRLANLSQKLDQAASRARVADWSARVEQEFMKKLPQLLRCDTIPEWASDLKVLELFLPIGGLSAEFQMLIGDLLEQRSGAAPWDLRARAGNKRFLRKMEKRGVNMRPWMDDAPVLTREYEDKTITFTLERDPLEVFRMGAHFKTCLSPGAFNYFSVFANAADINKQVLYGRREDGGVVARCLLALTNEGGILTFHPYCHEKKINFTQVLKEYVKTLAQTMNTAMLAQGTIARLVAPDWYDDGPIDVADHFGFLKDKTFLKQLENGPLDGVVEMLAAAVAPLALDELTLPTLLWLEAFTKRPELVQPLYSLVFHNERLPPELLLRVAELLIRCGEFRDAERLSPRLVRYALVAHRDYYDYVVTRCLDVLVQCSPTQALSLLKKTRRKDNRNWSQETDGFRLYVGALANLKLHRPRQAERLLAAGAKAPCCKEHRVDCQHLLKEIST